MCRESLRPTVRCVFRALGLRRLVRTWCAPLLLLPSSARAAEPAAAPSRPTASAVVDPDWRLTVSARQALQQDPALAPLNLGVSVCRRTATLWGVVPSWDTARRAERRLRDVPGLTNVHNELRVVLPDDPAGKILEPPPQPRSVPPLLDQPPRGPDSLTGRVGLADERTPPPTLVVTPPLALPRAPTRPVPAAPLPVSRPLMPRGPADLENAVLRLRQQDARFRDVRVEVRGRIVRLSGNPRQAWEVMQLATAVAQLPGVERVLVDGINADR